MSSPASAAAERDETETLDAKEVIAKQLEAILAKPMELGTKLYDAIGFLSIEGISELAPNLGYALSEMESGRWGQCFAHLVCTNEERVKHYAEALTLSEAIGAVMSDFAELLDLLIDSENEIEKVWAATQRAKDPEWKPQPQGEGAVAT